MSQTELESLTEKLGKTCIPKEEGVSFAGQSLKLNTAADAQVVVDKINGCPNMEFLNLEGNTLGVEAAQAIAKALESQPNMKKALWKDMFTGRMKDEIPKALKHLSQGLMAANARLEILDLSDNASGPIGVEGILDLIKSPTCYTLKELKLNNMGLGIGGAKLLANALRECYRNSKAAGTPLGLKVFIAGRNRLENDGVTALAQVFEEIGSLEEIQVPQNGIYLRGVQALSKAFAKNLNLREINLNDNTLNPEGSSEISKSLLNLKNLVKLDLGDCLMKNKGVLFLAEALGNGHSNLEEVIVSYNSVKTPGALALIEALEKKTNLKKLSLDGNKFGLEGMELVRKAIKNIGKTSTLGSLSDDEGSESDESDEEDYGRVSCECGDEHDSGEENCCRLREREDGDESGEYTEGESEEEEEDERNYGQEDIDNTETSSASEGFVSDGEKIIQSGYSSRPKTGSASDFLANPTQNNFNKLGDVAVSSIIQEIKEKPFDRHLDELMKAIIKVSSLIDVEKSYEDAANSWTMTATEDLFDVLFQWAEERKRLSYVNNTLPVYLGLIKAILMTFFKFLSICNQGHQPELDIFNKIINDEDTRKPVKNIKQGACLFAVNHLLNEQYFPEFTKDVLQMLIKSRAPA